MELTILIETGESCDFRVLDTTCGDFGYLSELSEEFEVDRFKYTETIGIIKLTLNKTTESIDKETIFIPHNVPRDYIKIPTEFDGWFTLTYIVIPTKEWFDKYQEDISVYDTVYYADGTDIYKYIDGESTLVDILEVFERNIADTTISKYTQDFTSICFLKKCFINICKLIFELRGFSKCQVNGKVDLLIIYNRDLVWMTINTISYLTEFDLLAEAERLIEIFEGGCNGICKQYYRKNDSLGCGCS